MLQLLLIDKKFQEVHPLLNQAGHLVDGWQGNQFQKEYLKVFFLVLQVSSLCVVFTLLQFHPFMKEIPNVSGVAWF
jgi:MAternally-affected-uncoordination protein